MNMPSPLQPVNIKDINFGEYKYAYPYFSSIRTELFGSVGPRGEYLWEWVIGAAKLTSLKQEKPSEDENLSNEIKRWGVLWDVVVDDVADEMPLDGAGPLLTKIASWDRDPVVGDTIEDRYIRYSRFIMDSVLKSLEQLPGYETHKEDLKDYYSILFKTMAFSLQLRSDPSQIKFEDYQKIFSHNMHMMINGIIDLMKINYPTRISDSESLKTILWNGQRMGRIGNATTTFARELPDGDFSSDVIALSLDMGVIKMEQVLELKNLVDTGEIERTKILAKHLVEVINKKGVQAELWQEWSECKKKIEQLAPEFKDLDIEGYLEGLIQLRKFHEMSEGEK